MKASSRTIQWKSMDPTTPLRCTHCQKESTIQTLDPEMRCPGCNHSEWVLAQPNSGERVQIPGDTISETGGL